jgi:hypothetical protein
MTPSTRSASPHHDERGASLLSLLFVLIILGVMAAATVGALDGTGSTTLPTTPGVTTTSTGETPNAAVSAALRATCVADYQTLAIALQVYSALHGANPTRGTSWAIGMESGSTLLESWPSDPGHFTITWNGTTLGVVPQRGVSASGSPGSQRSTSGCYASLS